MTHFEISRNEALRPFTTFRVGGPAAFFACAAAPEDFLEALRFGRKERLPVFVLGGGSNILVSDNGFQGLVIHPVQRGIAIQSAENRKIMLRVEAAETWDDVVSRAAVEGFYGIENLSHIPGQAGAAIVQNIGAYGQQISDAFSSATVMEIHSGDVMKLSAADCGFGYRKSIFNSSRRNQFIILQLELALSRRGKPNLRYPDVRSFFNERGIEGPSIQQVREAIIQIRDRKFPFPREEKGGNAGSFFKNLVLNDAEFEMLRTNLQRNFSTAECERLQEIRKRSGTDRPVKIPTAFLIEICGLKGHREGGARVNESQPLVLLNDGGATARDVLALAGVIRRTVHARTGMTIQLEPELVGFKPDEAEKYLALN
ncbi:MAG: UDP-N-acetylmuramate dehydrogenase [Acidobacteria bacterium]|nr:MAG: UDP-N-acetylmuramate dehydrogenase [Acidobacteriota bacterium]